MKSVEKLQGLGVCVPPRVESMNNKVIRPRHGLTDLGVSIGDYIIEYTPSKK